MAVYLTSNMVLFIKASVSIIASSVSSKDALSANASDFVSYIMFILWWTCLFGCEYWRQKALGHFGALYVVPLFAVGAIILESLMGMIFFQEYRNMSMQNSIYFCVGIAITILGVVKLSVDIAAVWTKLYDDFIRVSMVKHTEAKMESKTPKTAVYGGALAVYHSNYFHNHPSISYNAEFDAFMQMFGDKNVEMYQESHDGSNNNTDTPQETPQSSPSTNTDGDSELRRDASP